MSSSGRKIRGTRPVTTNAASIARTFLELRQITDQPLVVAVSGGADSVALLRILCELRVPLHLQVSAAHFDHQLRPESADDAIWVRELCDQLGVPCQVGTPASPVPPVHCEAWARRERYAFLQQVAHQAGARWVAVAHTADDQAETVLHHVIRGTGLAGLAGMPDVRKLARDVAICRPCLTASRQQLRDSLQAGNHTFRSDPSNIDGRFTRNAIRNELLPFIEQRFGRDPVPALLKLSEQARLSIEVIRRQARRLLTKAVVDRADNRVRLATRAVEQAPDLVIQEAAVLIWRRMNWPRREMSQTSWKRVAAVLKGHSTADQWPGHIRGTSRERYAVLERISPQTGTRSA